MTKHKTMQDLVKALEDITSLMQFFADGNEVPEIERDIVKDKLRWVYSEFLKIDAHNMRGTLKGNADSVSDEKSVTPVAEEQKLPVEDSSDSEDVGEIKDPESIEVPKNEMEFEAKTSSSDVSVSSDLQKTEQTEQPDSKDENGALHTLADKFKTGQASVNEYMAKINLRKDVASKLQGKPITDIHKAIGLNDKFQLINQLFKGDSDLYRKTIDRLNEAGSFDEAFIYVQDNFRWDLENELVQHILELARRKFITSDHE